MSNDWKSRKALESIPFLTWNCCGEKGLMTLVPCNFHYMFPLTFHWSNTVLWETSSRQKLLWILLLHRKLSMPTRPVKAMHYFFQGFNWRIEQLFTMYEPGGALARCGDLAMWWVGHVVSWPGDESADTRYLHGPEFSYKKRWHYAVWYKKCAKPQLSISLLYLVCFRCDPVLFLISLNTLLDTFLKV